MEDSINIGEKFKKSIQTLQYILESSVSSDIESVEITDFVYYPKHNFIEAKLIIKTWCEDHDFRSVGNVMISADKEIFKIINQYTFKSNGSLKKRSSGDDDWITVMPIEVKWIAGGVNPFDMVMEYFLTQDDYSE